MLHGLSTGCTLNRIPPGKPKQAAHNRGGIMPRMQEVTGSYVVLLVVLQGSEHGTGSRADMLRSRANYGHLCSNGATSNPQSSPVRLGGICDFRLPIVTSRNFSPSELCQPTDGSSAMRRN